MKARPAVVVCLLVLPNGEIACLYEAGQKNLYEAIMFAQFPLTARSTPTSPTVSQSLTPPSPFAAPAVSG